MLVLGADEPIELTALFEPDDPDDPGGIYRRRNDRAIPPPKLLASLPAQQRNAAARANLRVSTPGPEALHASFAGRLRPPAC